MRIYTSFLVVVALAAACGGNNKPDEPQTVQMKEHVQETIPPEPDRDMRAPAPPVAETAEELAVEMVDLNVGEPVTTEAGMTIRLTSGAPTYRVEFSKGGQTEVAEYSGDPLYIEGIAFGNLYTVSKFGEGVQATLRSDAPRAPLPAETAFEIARQEQKSQLGCEGEAQTYIDRNGTAVLRVVDASGGEACRIVVGLYTGRVVDL